MGGCASILGGVSDARGITGTLDVESLGGLGTCRGHGDHKRYLDSRLATYSSAQYQQTSQEIDKRKFNKLIQYINPYSPAIVLSCSTVLVEIHAVLLSLRVAVAAHSVDCIVSTELGRSLTLGENDVDRLVEATVP